MIFTTRPLLYMAAVVVAGVLDPDGERFCYLGEYSRFTGSASGRWTTDIVSFRSSARGTDCPYEDEQTVEGVTVTDSRTYGACNVRMVSPAVTVATGGALTLKAGERVKLLHPPYRRTGPCQRSKAQRLALS
jgi:hypothetical protein